MIEIVHLLDDGALGGVTRFLDALQLQLGPAFRHRRDFVSPRWSFPSTGNADVIVVHFSMSWSKLPYLMALRTYAPATPIVLVEHGYSGAFESLLVPSPRRFRAMLRLAYRLSDRVVSVSYGQASWMRKSRLLPASKLWIIRPFTDCGALASIAPPTSGTGPLRLGAFGRYCPQKDFTTLISSMRLVDPSTATLVIRGYGQGKDDLEQAAAHLPHVTIGGPVDSLVDFLSETDAIVVPSVFEPYGQVALEARLAARPLIVTDVDGLPEQVDTSFGHVVPPSAPHEMATAIEALCQARHEPIWEGMCNAARNSASGHVAASVKNWQRLLTGVMVRPLSTQPKSKFARI